MLSLLLAAYIPTQYITCTNCNGVGYFEVTCQKCNGSGEIPNTRFRWRKQNIKNALAVPCPNCTKGMVKDGMKGTGKKKETCKTCYGKKKLPVK